MNRWVEKIIDKIRSPKGDNCMNYKRGWCGHHKDFFISEHNCDDYERNKKKVWKRNRTAKGLA